MEEEKAMAVGVGGEEGKSALINEIGEDLEPLLKVFEEKNEYKETLKYLETMEIAKVELLYRFVT